MHVVQVVGRASQLQVVGDEAVPELVKMVMMIDDDGDDDDGDDADK